MNIGDRVQCFANYDHITIGQTGTVIDDNPSSFVGVRWDIASEDNHSCEDLTDRRHGYYVPTSHIRLLVKHIFKVSANGDYKIVKNRKST